MTTLAAYPPTVGLLLAGGAAKRMGGGDKGLRDIAGRTLLARAADRLAPQCERLLLNANGDPARFAGLSLEVIADGILQQPGPLGGILAGLDRLADENSAEWLLTAPADCPFLPRDLAERLHDARGSATIAIARSSGHVHPIIGLWHVSLRSDLYHALAAEDVRKAAAFVARHPHVIVDWPSTPADPFFNVNTPDDLAEAQRLVMHLADA